ncbi:MAG TPA: OmpA family protein [Bacteroidia bacterium]|jgi:outer membrane protein OmpA-like peptidoglycan-associated protein/tetratricopeptide (TPR) repeat protein|nr:OmpA family protein [Bacteroidia bacterium]
MLNRFAFFLLFITGLTVYSQSVSSDLRHAKNLVARGHYYLAADHYKEALKKDSLNKKANLEYGLLLTHFINNPGSAGTYLLRAERQSKKDTMPEVILGIAKYYQSKAEYAAAINYYKRMFSHIENNRDGRYMENIIRHSISSCEYGASVPSQPVYKRLKITNAGAGVNTIFPEYVPVITSNNTVLLFTSRRETNTGHKIDDKDGIYFEDMYIARKEQNRFIDVHPFSEKDAEVKGTKNTKGHDAVVSVSQAGDKFFTYRNNKIYESDLKDGSWSNTHLLDENINSPAGIQNHASISRDERIIYFSSDRPGGFGGLDIYKSEKQANGNWSPAVNLGPVVNTKDDDDSPFISEDGQTLYYSSKGLPGYGGYDLYRCILNGKEWGGPENLGKPFNTSGDDIHLTFGKREGTGYFSSSRAGGFGDMDIYEIRFEKPFDDFKNDSLRRIVIQAPDTVYTGDTVVLSIESTKLPPSEFTAYYWQVSDSVLKKESNKADYIFSKPGNIVVRAQAELNNSNFDLTGAEKTIFVSDKKPVTTALVNNTSNTLPLLEPVYFDFNKADINPAGSTALDRNIETLRKHAGLMIEISAYCDSRGSASYNRMLSQRRAIAAFNYLRQKGFNAKLVKKTGWFGESNPVNQCADGVTCTEEEYRLNRRVEIKWIEVKK